MNELPNADDPNFKSLIEKLKALKWLDRVIDTPATTTAKRNFNLVWSLPGQLSLMTIKNKVTRSVYWPETEKFLASLNEQESGFFRDVCLSAVPATH
jgi:hypothetical protein